MNFNILKKMLPAIEHEVIPAEKGVNRAALDVLKQDAARESDMALQAASGVDAPLTSNMDLSGIDRSKLPATNDTGFQLVGGPQDKGFTLGESGPISRPPVPYVAPEVGGVPATLKTPTDNIIDISPTASKWQKLKEASPYIGAAGAGLYLGAKSAQDDPQSARAAEPPKVTENPKQAPAEQTTPGKATNKSSLAVKAAAPSSVDSEVDDKEAPDFTPSKNEASIEKYKAIQAKMQDLQTDNEGGRIGAAMAAGMGGHKNEFDSILSDRSKRIGEMPAQYEKVVEFQKQDPKSAVSQTMRKMAEYLDLPVHGDMSAAEMEKAFPQMVNIKTREDMIEARKEMSKDRLAEHQWRMATLSSNNQDRKDMKQLAMYNDTNKFLEQLRGSPAVSQAEKDIYAADKAIGIKHIAGGDLNKLNPEMAKLYISEIAKIAQGGAPTIDELKALNPNTLRGRLSKSWQMLSNAPTSANLGKFLSQYEAYARELRGQAERVITDRYGRIIKSRKSQFTPEQAQALEDTYINRFLEQPEDKQPAHAAPASHAPSLTPDVSPSGGQLNSVQGPSSKQVVKKGYNAKTNQTQLIYSDGSKEVVSGRQ